MKLNLFNLREAYSHLEIQSIEIGLEVIYFQNMGGGSEPAQWKLFLVDYFWIS